MGGNRQRDTRKQTQAYANIWRHIQAHASKNGHVDIFGPSTISTQTPMAIGTAQKTHMAMCWCWQGPHMEGYICLWQTTPGTLQYCTFLHGLPPICNFTQSANLLGSIFLCNTSNLTFSIWQERQPSNPLTRQRQKKRRKSGYLRGPPIHLSFALQPFGGNQCGSF